MKRTWNRWSLGIRTAVADPLRASSTIPAENGTFPIQLVPVQEAGGG